VDTQGQVGVVVDQHPRQALGPQGSSEAVSSPPPDFDHEVEAELMRRLEDEDRMGHAAGGLGYAGEDVEEEPGRGVARVEEAGAAARRRLRAAAQVQPGAGDGVPRGGPRW
jgi:hypothetical protein